MHDPAHFVILPVVPKLKLFEWSEMSLKKHSFDFNFNFGNKEKLHGVNSDKYGG